MQATGGRFSRVWRRIMAAELDERGAERLYHETLRFSLDAELRYLRAMRDAMQARVDVQGSTWPELGHE